MAIRIEIRVLEDISSALWRLRKKAFLANRRAWAKRRLGYYEKPSTIRRKRQQMDRRNIRAELGEGLRLWLRLEQQLVRSGPFAMGR